MKKILPPSLFLIFAGAMIAIGWIIPLKAFPIFTLQLSGSILILLGLLMSYAAIRRFSKLKIKSKVYNKPRVLFTDGLFRFSRNPIYLGFTVALLGLAVVVGSLSAIILWVLFIVLADKWYISYEEKKLKDKFGEDYIIYKRQVPRWI